jgi:threonine/homoserine/homoserine lactone efflux protein
MVYRSVSPEAYWTYTELYIFMAMVMFAFSIAPVFEVIAQEKLRQSTPFQKILLWGSGLLFSILVAAVIWSCKNS